MEYWGKGTYIGEEFPDETGKEIKVGSDESNGVYKIKFVESKFEADNIFEEEIKFNN
jgi:hypothetical protein